MNSNDILKYVAVAGASAIAGFFIGKYWTEKQLVGSDIWDEIEDGINEFENSEPIKVVKNFEKPSMNDFVKDIKSKATDYTTVVEDLGYSAKEKAEEVMDEAEKIVDEVKETAEGISEVVEELADRFASSIEIVTEEDYKEMTDPMWDKLTATYFEKDGVLAGFDDELDELDPEENGLDKALSTLAKNKQLDSVYVRNSAEMVMYEIIRSKGAYSEQED